MTTQEHLEKIKTKCQELLAVAEKRTPGEWNATWNRVKDSCNDTVCFATGGASENSADQWPLDASFIASCAGSAEAGWRAAIAAIDWIQAIRHQEGPKGTHEMVCNLIASWPEELLK